MSENLKYLRHKRGGGKLFDISEACEKSYVDRASEIRNESSVWQSKIINSLISEESFLSGAVVENSKICASTIAGGIIKKSFVSCELVQGNAKIENSQILEKSRIAHSAHCRNVSFKNLTVKGTAKLLDWKQNDGQVFDGLHGYITGGIWMRPPKIFRLSFGVTITESVEGKAFVACKEFSIERWLKIGDRYGRAQGWTAAQVDDVRRILLELQKQ